MSDSTRTAAPIADPVAPEPGASVHQAGAKPRPFQYSLWSLMALVTLLAPLVAAASGAFGEYAQAIVLMVILFIASATAVCLVAVLVLLCLMAIAIPMALFMDRLLPTSGLHADLRRSRRRFQFSLRTLLLIVTIGAPLIAALAGAFGDDVQSIAFVLGLVTPGALVATFLVLYGLLLLMWPFFWIVRHVRRRASNDVWFLVRRRS